MKPSETIVVHTNNDTTKTIKLEGPVIVVTGANRGIGLEIVKRLAEEVVDGVVYCTARDVISGQAVVDQLNQQGHTRSQLCFHELDVSKETSIVEFRRFLRNEHDGLDILINNAGIAFSTKKQENVMKTLKNVAIADQVRETIDTNFMGPYNMYREMLTIMRPNGRIINISSKPGNPSIIHNDMLSGRLFDPKLTPAELSFLMETYVSSAKHGQHKSIGFPDNAYFVSKLGLTLLSFAVQRYLDRKKAEANYSVIACSPGWVKTRMTDYHGNLSVEEGARLPVRLALAWSNADDPFHRNVAGRFVCEDGSCLTFDQWHRVSSTEWNADKMLGN